MKTLFIILHMIFNRVSFSLSLSLLSQQEASQPSDLAKQTHDQHVAANDTLKTSITHTRTYVNLHRSDRVHVVGTYFVCAEPHTIDPYAITNTLVCIGSVPDIRHDGSDYPSVLLLLITD